MTKMTAFMRMRSVGEELVGQAKGAILPFLLFEWANNFIDQKK
jgi:hypothetical protein